jgi:O-antigen/teichoic acid export membrane protein
MLNNIFSTTVANLSIQILGLLTGIILARYLGVESRGEWAVILFWPVFLVNIAVFGVDVFLSKIASRSPKNPGVLYVYAIKLSLILGIILIFTIFLLSNILLPDSKSNLLSLFYLVLLHIPFSIFTWLVYSIELGRKHIKNYNRIRVIFSITYLVILIANIIIFGNLNLESLVISFIGVNIITSLFIFGLIQISRDSFYVPIKIKEIFMGGLPYGFITLVNNMATQMPLLFFLYLSTNEALGFYVIAYSVASMHSFIGLSISKVFFSESVGKLSTAEKDVKWLSLKYKKILFIYIVFSFIFLLAVYPLVIILYGMEYEKSAYYAIFLIPATIFLSASNILEESLKGYGLVKSIIQANLLFVFVFIFTLLLMIYFDIGSMFDEERVIVSLIIASFSKFISICWHAKVSLSLSFRQLLLVDMEDVRDIVFQAKVLFKKIFRIKII